MIFKLQRPLGGDLTYALLTNAKFNVEQMLPMQGAIATLFKDCGNPPRLWIEMSGATISHFATNIELPELEITKVHLTDPDDN